MNNLVYINNSGTFEGGDCCVLCDRHLNKSMIAGDYSDVYGNTDKPCDDCKKESEEEEKSCL